MASPNRAQRRHPERFETPEAEPAGLALSFLSGGQIQHETTVSMLHLLIHDGLRHGRIGKHGAVVAAHSSPRIAAGRNGIVRDFLKLPPSVKYHAWVDSDMTFEPWAFDTLIETMERFDLGIVGGLCFVGGRGQGDMYPTIYVLDPRPDEAVKLRMNVVGHYPKESVVECDATGAAFMVVRRDVYLKVGQKYARLGDGNPNPNPWFQDGTHEGSDNGEDIVFCVRARLNGFKVGVDTRVKTGHIKHYELDEAGYETWLEAHGAEPLKVGPEAAPEVEIFEAAGPLETFGAIDEEAPQLVGPDGEPLHAG